MHLKTSALLLAAFAATTSCARSKNSPAVAGAPTPNVEDVHTFLSGQPIRAGDMLQVAYGSNVKDATFKCALDIDGKTGDWLDCPATAFSGRVPSGSSYTFHVKAVAPTGVEDAHPLTFTDGPVGALAPNAAPGATALASGLPGRLVVNGMDELKKKATKGIVHLSWDATQQQGVRVACALDQAEASDCLTGYDLDLAGLAAGNHVLSIAATAADGRLVAQAVASFCIGDACAAPGPDPEPPMAFQIGSFYQYVVPQGMHVTEYATSKTNNGALSFYRVMAYADPYYLGIYPCTGPFDTKIKLPGGPGGTALDYCWSTPREDEFKFLNDARIARNHLEIASDAAGVTAAQHDILSIDVFDKDYEFMTKRSRFERLCGNQAGNLRMTPPIAFIGNDFWGLGVVLAPFFMCTTDIAQAAGPAFPTRDPEFWRNRWWVGVFYIAASGTQMPSFECYNEKDTYKPTWCGTFNNPSLLEVTFISKTPYMTPEDFARAAQARFVNNLSQILPLGNGVAPAPLPPPEQPVPHI